MALVHSLLLQGHRPLAWPDPVPAVNLPTKSSKRAHQALCSPKGIRVGMLGAEEALGGLLRVALHVRGRGASSAQGRVI